MKITSKILVTVCMVLFFVLPAGATQPNNVQESIQQARTAGVSEHVLNRLLTAGYSFKVRSQHMVQWLAMVEEAAEQGIPQAPLVDKLEEGLSKRIETARINAALKKQLEHLQWADQLLQHRFRKQHKNSGYPMAVTRIADLMMTGLSQEETRLIIQATPAPQLNTAMNALTFYTVLNQSDIPADNAQQIVVAGLKKGFFSKFPVDLAFLIKTAHGNHIPIEDIIRETDLVLNSQQSVEQMQHRLKLESVQHPTAVSGPNRFRNGDRMGADQDGSGSGNSGGRRGGQSGSGGRSSSSGGSGGSGSSGGGHGNRHGRR